MRMKRSRRKEGLWTRFSCGVAYVETYAFFSVLINCLCYRTHTAGVLLPVPRGRVYRRGRTDVLGAISMDPFAYAGPGGLGVGVLFLRICGECHRSAVTHWRFYEVALLH